MTRGKVQIMGHQCCHTTLSDEEIQNLLIHSGMNRTKIKIEIMQLMAQSIRPLSVMDIHDLLNKSCDISTVFRTMTQFKDKKIINEVNLDEGFLRYEIVYDQEKDHHHHYVRCRDCGDIQHIKNCHLEVFEKAIAKLGFTSMEHRLEFTGMCSRCTKAK